MDTDAARQLQRTLLSEGEERFTLQVDGQSMTFRKEEIENGVASFRNEYTFQRVGG